MTAPSREGQDRQALRDLLQAGAKSGPGTPADTHYFNALREQVRQSTGPQEKT
jgi:hypothetical protein